MTPFWLIALGLGAVWFVSSGRAQAIIDALTGDPAPVSASAVVPQAPNGNTTPGQGNSPQPPSSTQSGLAVNVAPRLTASQIDTVLGQYHSPAAGLGQTFYDEGVRSGIDPAIALAFFVHESTAGTQGVARVTRSIGNIRATGNEPAYQGFKQYATWQAGIRDYYRLISQAYVSGRGLTTVEGIIPIYAPRSDGNNPTGYIQTVRDLIRRWTEGTNA